MPTSEPWTQAEVTRAVTDIKNMLADIVRKLEERPDWNDIKRLEAHRDSEQEKQDKAITAVETKQTQLMFWVLGSVFTALLSVASSILPG